MLAIVAARVQFNFDQADRRLFMEPCRTFIYQGFKTVTLCPVLGTHFVLLCGVRDPKLEAKQMDQPATVVRDTLRAFAQGKRVAYPGKLLVRLSTWGARLMPRDMILRIAAGTVKNLNQKSQLQHPRKLTSV